MAALLAAAGGAAVALGFTAFTTSDPSPSLVTITPTDKADVFLVADYSKIYAFDRSTGVFEPFAIQGASRRNVPTGLAFDKASGRLFIANYHSNNVLVARVDLPNRTIAVEEEFGHDIAVSPENVAVEAPGGRVALANYDGQDVQIWSRRQGRWVRDCSVPVPLAHGVTFADGVVFATSLGNRELLKIDPDRCEVVARLGKAGWGRRKFLWPTHVLSWGDAHVAVSDAHTGRLSVHRRTDLAPVSTFGGNGPSLLNMPYAFARATDGEGLILSTFGREVLRVPAWKLRWWTILGGDVDAWDPASALHRRSWSSYRRTDESSEFLGTCVQEGYARLHGCRGTATFLFPTPEDEYLSAGSYYYFVEVAASPKGWILTSPQNQNLLFVRRSDLRFAVAAIGYDAWRDGSRLLTPKSAFSVDEIEASSLRFLEQADQTIGSGARTIEQAARLLARASVRLPLDASRDILTPEPASDRQAAAAERFAGQMHARLNQAGLGEFIAATESCAAGGGCTDAKLCEIARTAALPLAVPDKEVSLSALLTAAMLNPCVGRSFVEDSRVGTK